MAPPLALEFLIPYYGDPGYLFEGIEAIRAVEDTDWVLTVVDDQYPEGAVVEEKVLALGDPRIRYHRNERNLGVSANAHHCIQLAERDHFLVLGFDDRVLPNYGRVVAAALARHPEAALVQPRVRVIDEDGREVLPLPDRIKGWLWPGPGEVVLTGEAAVRSLLRGNWLYTPALCFERRALQRTSHRPGIDVCHDLAFVVDVLLDGGSLVVTDEVCFEYRRHGGSYSMSYARSGARFEQERSYFASAAGLLQARGWRSAERMARLRPTSRLNAITQVPRALRGADRHALATLLRHVLR
jgi:Glycosyl transferase family 2